MHHVTDSGLRRQPTITETTSEVTLKILVVDDHALLRKGFFLVLQELDAQVEVLEAADCASAFALAHSHTDLDLVLLDYEMPDMTGIDALDHFARRHPELPIVIISGVATPLLMQQAMLKGAAGFVTKSAHNEALLLTLRRVLQGEIVRPAELTSSSRANASELGIAATLGQLTPRQEDVLYLLLAGHSTRVIGNKLFLSEETIKTHVSAIIRAFGAKTRLEAILAANHFGYGKLKRST
jgi:DNA-binding NarL/FixJ family response regulator